jgi:hypothetical protein
MGNTGLRQGNPSNSEKNCSTVTLSISDPTWPEPSSNLSPSVSYASRDINVLCLVPTFQFVGIWRQVLQSAVFARLSSGLTDTRYPTPPGTGTGEQVLTAWTFFFPGSYILPDSSSSQRRSPSRPGHNEQHRVVCKVKMSRYAMLAPRGRRSIAHTHYWPWH